MYNHLHSIAALKMGLWCIALQNGAHATGNWVVLLSLGCSSSYPRRLLNPWHHVSVSCADSASFTKEENEFFSVTLGHAWHAMQPDAFRVLHGSLLH